MTNPDGIMRVDTTTEYKTLDEILAALGVDNAEPASLEEDYASNAPCDFSGYCTGSSCPYFFKCKGD
jgi:hypothetical protein